MRTLRLNQKKALSYCCRVSHPALFMEMRLGKTLVTIRRIKMVGAQRILIVCPYSAFYSWENELRLEGEIKFGFTELIGTRQDRFDKLNENSKWFIINKEGHLVLPELSKKDWDAVIIDESTCIKNPESKIAKFYIDNFRNVKIRFVLSGTPAPESEFDYFAQLKFLDEKIFIESNYWEFKHRNFGTIGHDMLISPRGAEYIPQRLSKYCFFQTRRECKLGGLKIYERQYVELTAEELEVYMTAKKKFILEIGGNIVDSTIFSMPTYIWMRKICGGIIDERFNFGGKYRELLHLLGNQLKDQQVVIWCIFRDELDMLEEGFTENNFSFGRIDGKVKIRERDLFLKSFQNGNFQYLLCQPECFKHGVNLSCTSTMIYYSTPVGLETRLQSEDRTIDVLKTDSSLIIDLVTKDTIEEGIVESLVAKEGRQEMMRRIVHNLQKGK